MGNSKPGQYDLERQRHLDPVLHGFSIQLGKVFDDPRNEFRKLLHGGFSLLGFSP